MCAVTAAPRAPLTAPGDAAALAFAVHDHLYGACTRRKYGRPLAAPEDVVQGKDVAAALALLWRRYNEHYKTVAVGTLAERAGLLSTVCSVVYGTAWVLWLHNTEDKPGLCALPRPIERLHACKTQYALFPLALNFLTTGTDEVCAYMCMQEQQHEASARQHAGATHTHAAHLTDAVGGSSGLPQHTRDAAAPSVQASPLWDCMLRAAAFMVPLRRGGLGTRRTATQKFVAEQRERMPRRLLTDAIDSEYFRVCSETARLLPARAAQVHAQQLPDRAAHRLRMPWDKPQCALFVAPPAACAVLHRAVQTTMPALLRVQREDAMD